MSSQEHEHCLFPLYVLLFHLFSFLFISHFSFLSFSRLTSSLSLSSFLLFITSCLLFLFLPSSNYSFLPIFPSFSSVSFFPFRSTFLPSPVIALISSGHFGQRGPLHGSAVGQVLRYCHGVLMRCFVARHTLTNDSGVCLRCVARH